MSYQQHSLAVHGLLDTAAAVNVLPYDVGLQLGAAWDQQNVRLQLTGNLAACEARALLVTVTVGRFPPISLAFAWAKTNASPLLLGQVNFSMEFDVYLSRDQGFFEVKPK